MQGADQTFSDVEAGQAVYNVAESFETPRGSSSAWEINNLSTGQFREACWCATVVDSFLQLPRHISDQFGVSTSNSDAGTLCYVLEDVPEGKEEDEATEDKEKQQDYSLFDASCIDSDGLDGALFPGELDKGAPHDGKDRGQRCTQFDQSASNKGSPAKRVTFASS